jgi:hypothetical protein
MNYVLNIVNKLVAADMSTVRTFDVRSDKFNAVRSQVKQSVIIKKNNTFYVTYLQPHVMKRYCL